MHTFFIRLKVFCVPPTLVALKRAVCGLALRALERTGCHVWQLECQASNVTASVQSDHVLHGYMLPFFFATGQLHLPLRSAEMQPVSQQDASATRPYRGLYSIHELLQHASDAVIYRAEVRTVGWPHVRTDELRRLTAQKLDCVTSTICWRIVLLEDKHC